MLELQNDYLLELASQISFLSAFMGGFSATFLATLLVADSTHRIGNYAAGSAAVSASAFIVAVLSMVSIIAATHPHAPSGVDMGVNVARLVGFGAFVLGTSSLLISVGLSGWLRSNSLGIFTSMVSFLCLILVTWALLGFS